MVINCPVFVIDPSDLNYVAYVLHKLDSEQERLLGKKVPIKLWPRQLQDPEWDLKIVHSFLGEDVPYGEIGQGNRKALTLDSSKRIRELWRLRPVKASQSPIPVDDTPLGKPQDEPESPREAVRGEAVRPEKFDDITKSDGFGSLLGEEEEPMALGHRRRR